MEVFCGVVLRKQTCTLSWVASFIDLLKRLSTHSFDYVVVGELAAEIQGQRYIGGDGASA